MRRFQDSDSAWADFGTSIWDAGCQTPLLAVEHYPYRYSLGRLWDPSLPFLAVIGLNPSTADHKQNDPTVTRCINYARKWGHGGLVMLNLFAYRATDPKLLLSAVNPVGPENDDAIDTWARNHWVSAVVCAWGAVHKKLVARAGEVSFRLRGYRDLLCLDTTQAGAPRHPLYMKGDLLPKTWRVKRI